MKQIIAVFLFFGAFFSLSANLLYDIADGKYKPKETSLPVSMNDGEHYITTFNNKAVVKYNYKTGQVVDTLFSIARFEKFPLKEISGCILSPAENKLLVYSNVQKRYRRTFIADYYVIDIKRNEFTPLSEYGSQQSPVFSPNGRYVAFARDNNLFMKKLDFDTELPITKDGVVGKIINGIPDWVYEEEFLATHFYVWSPDSKMLAFLKFDESQVDEFEYIVYKEQNSQSNPTDPWNLYPSSIKYKYPKAGKKNSIVNVCVYDDFNKTTKIMKLNEQDENGYYIPCIKWTNSIDKLAVFTLNRNQNQLKMYLANPKSTVSTLVLQQKDKYYLNFEFADKVYFTKDEKSFLIITEADGYSHLYQYTINGILEKQITKGAWDLTDFYGYDEQKKIVYYQSAEDSPLRRDIYSLDYKGKKTKLTNGVGFHKATFNSTLTNYIDIHSSLEYPTTQTLNSNTGVKIRELEDNSSLKKEFEALKMPKKEFFSFTTSEKIKLNGWMIKPVNFDSSKKYPLLMIQYSGPNSQQVRDSWNIGWEYYLASKGYVVACVDGRGTAARGTEFRKCTHQQLGLLETKDQVEAAKYFGNLSYIEKDRIGIWGWSYGGFMTLLALSDESKVFKAGISVAPVTDWRFYNTAYTERYMKRPQENFNGYDDCSPMLQAQKLSGKLLIIHGTADDNVHVQNTMLYIDQLVEADKQFEMQIYTDKNHSITGEKTRRHLYTRMSEFIFHNL